MVGRFECPRSEPSERVSRRLRRGFLTVTNRWRLTVVLAVLLVTVGLTVWPVIRAPVEPPASLLVVNDVSQLNPIKVSGIIAPKATGEIADAVMSHAGPISIGGARHSMGGQIATDGALHIDMRQLN